MAVSRGYRHWWRMRPDAKNKSEVRLYKDAARLILSAYPPVGFIKTGMNYVIIQWIVKRRIGKL